MNRKEPDMNRLIENPRAERLLMTGYGLGPDEGPLPIHLDEDGRPVPSVDNAWAIQANNLGIRPLAYQTDSALITATDLDIRNLSGTADAVRVSRQSSASASASSSVGLLIPVYFLPTDMSSLQQNTFIVANRAVLSLSVRINLQIAPINDDNYYVNDGSSYDLIGGGIQAFTPSKVMRWGRIRVAALLATANVEVYYFGRT
jgi:hypothetical protein